MQRACAGALLHHGKTRLHNPGYSDDEKAGMNIITQLGASVVEKSASFIEIISGGLKHEPCTVHCGESGLSARLFTPIAALNKAPVIISGRGGLLKRPMDVFSKVLPELGVNLPDFNGYLPFTVDGPLVPKAITVDGSLSSQFLSGVLFAVAYAATSPVTIHVTDLTSKPYIDLTLEVLERFGRKIHHDDYSYFHIVPSLFNNLNGQTIDINVEADWSSAAFWLVGGAIRGNVTLKNLNTKSFQADKKLLDVLNMTGTSIDVQKEQINISDTSRLKSFVFDATECPDLFPVLAVLAGSCEGESSIKGLHRLIHKESNRTESTCNMLEQFGIPYRINEDTLFITGQQQFSAANIDGANDHRIVMAAAIGALRSNGQVTISDAHAADKSYPAFFNHLSSLGIHCSLNT